MRTWRRGLGATGFDVHVALGAGGPNLDRLKVSGATIHQVRANLRSAYDPRILGRILRLVRRLRPDVVQVWIFQMEILGGLAAIANGTPWIFSERASKDAYPANARMFARLRIARFANAIVANSMDGDRYWQPRVSARVLRYVIRNAIPLDEIGSAPAARAQDAGVEPGRPLVLFAGRLDGQKNLEVLFQALKKVLARHPAQVLCCGEGPLRAQCQRWIVEHGLAERVRLTGYVPNLWSLMKLADVFVSPSLFEGSPNVVLEAMASGCPLVVSDIATHREILDERSAVLVDPQSPVRLAEALDATLTNRPAAEARAQVARAAAERYSVTSMAAQYASVYRDVLAQSASLPVGVAR